MISERIFYKIIKTKAVNMGDDNIKKFKRTVVKILFNFVQVVCRFMLKIVYGGPGQKMPPIKNLLLLDSASTLALKIRTKKVMFFIIVTS